MEINEVHNKTNDPQVKQLLDNVLDAVLALKAHIGGLEQGFEFPWGYHYFLQFHLLTCRYPITN